MSEKKYKQLRQRLGYKPTYAGRKYRLIDRITESIKRRKQVAAVRNQRTNVGARAVYRQEKKLMKEE